MAELFKLVGTIAIDSTDSTEKINAIITAGADLEAKLNGIGANAESSIGSKSGFAAASVWLGNQLTELTQRAAQLGKEFILSGLKYNAAMEGYEVSFATLLNGDTEKANALMESIKQFALDSPLNVTGVASAALDLLNVGTAYEDIMPMLEMIGNLALGDENKMSRITTALSQVLGFNQLYAQEKQQFINAGVPIYKLLEDYYKIVQGNHEELDLDAMQRAGQITSEDVLGALQLSTMSDKEIYEKYGFIGEREISFYNAIAAMLPTFTGQTQKANEQSEMAAGEFVKPYQEELTKNVLPAFTEFMSSVAENYKNSEENNNFAKTVGGFATNILEALTDAVNGKFSVTPENEENLTVFGKWVAGIYDFEDFLNELQRKEPSTDEIGGGGRRFGDDEDKEDDEKGGTSGILKQLQDNMHNLGMLFVSANGMPEMRNGYDSDNLDRAYSALVSGGVGGAMGMMGMIASVQALTAAVQNMTGTIPDAISSGVGNITVTGHVTTGNVTLDTGAIVGQIAPSMNLALGGMNAISGRG